ARLAWVARRGHLVLPFALRGPLPLWLPGRLLRGELIPAATGGGASFGGCWSSGRESSDRTDRVAHRGGGGSRRSATRTHRTRIYVCPESGTGLRYTA